MPPNNPPEAELAALFKALAHPARLAIIQALQAGEACVCHLEAGLGWRQAYLSQQLMVLREAGLVSDRREGWNVYYRLAQPELADLLTAARHVTSAPAPASAPWPERLPHCPCPRCQATPVPNVLFDGGAP